jgi:hypothetical protein
MRTGEIRLAAHPLIVARTEGVLYLLMIAAGLFVEIGVRQRIFIAGDAAATAANLRSMEALWRIGITVEMIMVMCTVVSALLLYVLLRPVSRDLALLATFFGLSGVAIEGSHALHLVQTMFPLGEAQYLNAFSEAQRQALAALSVRAHANGFGVALFVFGPAFLLRGFLIFKSTFFPKILGGLYMLAGAAYVTNSIALVLAPQLAGRVFLLIAGPAFVGEMSLCLWLLIKGVDVDAWRRRSEAATRDGEAVLVRGAV